MKSKLLKNALTGLFGLIISAGVQAVPIVGGLGTVAATPALDFSAFDGEHAGILTVDGFQFAERFVGQTVSPQVGPSVILMPWGLIDPEHDTVTTASTGNPLALASAGTGIGPNNIGVIGAANAVFGYGPDKYGLYGVGALSILFPDNLFEIGFDIIGAAGGSDTLFFQFFEADGQLIGDKLVMDALNGSYGFKTDHSYTGPGIRGMTVFNQDTGGLALVFPKQTVPTPATLLLLIGGLGLMMIFRLRGREARVF